jgi:hypothetical protein
MKVHLRFDIFKFPNFTENTQNSTLANESHKVQC